jgi:hypothetical protein
MANPGNPGDPDTGFPPPSPARTPEPQQTPLPEPLGIPGGMPPEIVP